LSELTNSSASLERTKSILSKIADGNEAISYLRAKCIGGLIQRAMDIFFHHNEAILAGNFNNTLVGEIEKDCPFLKKIEEISIDKIYNHASVIEVELAGYNVMSEILSVFINAVLSEKKTQLEKKCIQLIPAQYNLSYDDLSPYEKTMGVLDFVSGMTDGYATEMYRKMKGIDIASHK
jgi:dGTPase